MVKKVPSVCTVGEPLVVLVPDRAARLEQIHHFEPFVAGAELNTAIGLARLGIDAHFACGMGQDPFGRTVTRALLSEGVNTSLAEQVSGGQTGVFFKEWNAFSGSTSVYYYRSQSTMGTGLWDGQVVADSLSAGKYSWLHLTGITAMVGEQMDHVVSNLLYAAKRGGATVSFDINIRLKLAPKERWRALADGVMHLLDWFFIGDEEALTLYQTVDPIEIDQIVRQHGFAGDGVVLKRGSKGATLIAQGQAVSVPAWPVRQVVDTVGAGDGFNAGFIAGHLRGMPVEECMKLGSVIGAYAVTSAGDYEGYPYWNDVQKQLNQVGEIER